MPRIRSLKPEHKQHRKVGRLSHVLYRLWIGMITEADDAGRLVAETDQLRVLVFGYHPKITDAIVQRLLEELAGTGLCRIYTVEGVQYADFPSWADHQRVDHPTPSKLPAYKAETVLANVRECSRGLANDPGGSDLIGEDRRGSDRRGSGDAREQFEDFWQQYPKKIGKGEAKRAWGRSVEGVVTPADLLAALERQQGYLAREGGRFIPNPATWLNQGRWQDDPPTAAPELSPTTAANLRAAQDAITRHRERRT